MKIEFVNEDVMEMIEQVKNEEGKVLELKQEDYRAYATYMYDMDDGKNAYYLHMDKRPPRFGTKDWLHDMVMNQDEVNVVNIEELNQEEKLRKFQSRGYPKDEVHIIVKTTEDGRYKDEYMYVRKGGEYKQQYLGGKNDENSKFEYKDLGTFREVMNSDGYNFNLKPFSGAVPSDLLAVISKEEQDKLKEKLNGK